MTKSPLLWTPPLSPAEQQRQECIEEHKKKIKAEHTLKTELTKVIEDIRIKDEDTAREVEKLLMSIITRMSGRMNSIFFSDRVLAEVDFQLKVREVQKLAIQLLGHEVETWILT